jgi:translocator protein
VNKALSLMAFLLLTLAVGGLGGWATSQSVLTWFPTLIKPSWTPPSYLFGPVWTGLYVLMAISAWLIWKHEPNARGALLPYFIQLALNLAWSFVFFGLQQPGLAVANILALWVAIAWTIKAFSNQDRIASWLLAPYLVWVTFAAALNISIWWLN